MRNGANWREADTTRLRRNCSWWNHFSLGYCARWPGRSNRMISAPRGRMRAGKNGRGKKGRRITLIKRMKEALLQRKGGSDGAALVVITPIARRRARPSKGAGGTGSDEEWNVHRRIRNATMRGNGEKSKLASRHEQFRQECVCLKRQIPALWQMFFVAQLASYPSSSLIRGAGIP